MMRLLMVVVGTFVLIQVPRVEAADHTDSPMASEDPAADITDVLAWMSSDASRVNLVMGLVRNATMGSRFSDQVQYVFHTTSRSQFGAAASPEVNVICTFDAAQRIECWAGDAYVTGDAGQTSGLSSSDGTLRVFAGLRDDPFFFNFSGFRATAQAVTAAAPSLTFDDAGCPALDEATSNVLVTQLATEPDGGPAIDDFAGLNVLALVVSVDKSILTQDGPILSVWGSTNKR